MAHTFTGPHGTVFMSNSDLSGDIIIQQVRVTGKDTRYLKEVGISSKDLLAFVAEHVRSERIRQLENMNDMEIFGLE